MWNEPLKTELARIPQLNGTEKVPLSEKLIQMHFFIGGCDWYIVEFDGENIFFGFAILGNDAFNAEWGYISLSELKSVKISGIEVDRDLFWQIRPAMEVDRIRQCHCHNHW